MIIVQLRVNKGRLIIAAVLCAALFDAPTPAAQRVTSEQVRNAIDKGVTYLRQRQNRNGEWDGIGGYPGGTTGMCLLALLNAGVGADDPAVAAGLDALAKVPDQRTYVVAIKCQVFAAAGLEKYSQDLRASADWLTKTQLKNGMWSYGVERNRPLGRGDNSNTQFALLGLHEAAKADVKVAKSTWQRGRQHFINTQLKDGGWTYVFNPAAPEASGSYGSMTAAGVASLFICGQKLDVGGRKVFVNGAYPDCGKYRQNVKLAAGIKWLEDNFSVTNNPRGGGNTYYYLYALERVGMISGQRYFGSHDWYLEGAERLVASQQRTGGWGSQMYETAFALLFLAKGNRPVLFQKLQWDGYWNRNIHDLENLCVFIGDKFGKPVTWQSISLEAPLQELRATPILVITGHEFPKLTGPEKEKLKQYVETGGTLLAEACCGSTEFADGFKALADELFPEYSLKKLDASHPVFSSYNKIEDTYDLHGIDIGCRTAVFFSPRALSCLWELQTIPEHSEKAFRLGMNIAAYATGREMLPDRLDVVELPAAAAVSFQPAEIPRGAVRLARLVHDGDYNADIHCLVNLAADLRDKAKIDVVAQGRSLAPDDEKLYEYPVVFMTGHYGFGYSDKQIAAFRKYLDSGGVLVADACCGAAAFDKSFRELAAKLYPDNKLKLLEEDHPIFTGKAGSPLGELLYRKVLADELKSRGTTRPPIEAVVIDGRTVILYSKYDFSCALEGDKPYSCRGYQDADGRKLALNLFLYAITY